MRCCQYTAPGWNREGDGRLPCTDSSAQVILDAAASYWLSCSLNVDGELRRGDADYAAGSISAGIVSLWDARERRLYAWVVLRLSSAVSRRCDVAAALVRLFQRTASV